LRAVVNHPATRRQLGKLRGPDAAQRQAAAGWFAALPAREYPPALAEALLEALAWEVHLPRPDRELAVIRPRTGPAPPPSDPAVYLRALSRVAPHLEVRPFVYEPFRAYGTPGPAYLSAVRELRQEKRSRAMVPLLLRQLRYCLRAVEDGAPAAEAARELLTTLAGLAPEDRRVVEVREYVHYHPRRQVRELFD
jgi:hypothetical protein